MDERALHPKYLMARKSLTIYYDGECPVCSNYVRYYRLGEGNIDISLEDVRGKPEKISEFNSQGLNLDTGIIVLLDKAIYHGAEAVNILALLSSPVGFFNRMNRWIFSKRKVASILYPILVIGRNFLLLLLGRKKINAD